MPAQSKISPFLWFNDNAEEAMNFYLSVFKNSKAISTMPGPGGKAMGVEFELEGQRFMGLNGGPMFKFTEAISFYVSVETQAEVDYYWGKLSASGEESRCGWLKDKFGLSWQIIPTTLTKMLSDKDAKKAQAAMQAMLKMRKIEIADLQKAYDNA